MDYEKMYKEALERAKKFEEKYGGGYAEYIFPELAESEDERIRKELKEAFEAYDIESKWNGIPIRSIFAWLEKQKDAITDITMTEAYKMGLEAGKASSWKPSEEQMSYLLSFHQGGEEQKPLRELIEQLKKLM